MLPTKICTKILQVGIKPWLVFWSPVVKFCNLWVKNKSLLPEIKLDSLEVTW